MHSLRAIAPLLTVLFCASAADAQPIVLGNDLWQIVLEPETLAIAARPAKGGSVTVSTGVETHGVSLLKASDTSASWVWQQGKVEISASLEKNDLSLTWTKADPGELAIFNQPPEAWGKALAFPLSEGAYIPADSKVWHDFLLEDLPAFNTTQDISLPLWTTLQDGYSVSVILTNPFNNRGAFKAAGNGLSLSLSHEFTALDASAPMTMLVHLGADDPLAGAKRYREWLQANGRYQTLASKIEESPDAAKLIGAPHTYLWGSGLLSTRDVADWKALMATLTGKNAFAQKLLSGFEKDVLSELRSIKGKPQAYQQKMLIRALNQSIDQLARAQWQGAKPEPQRLGGLYRDIRSEVAKTFSGALKPDTAAWGSGLSTRTINTLKASGLDRLWIGIGEGWEGGLWHPEAVKAAADAGFLIAPYDSYETALQQSDDPSWASAHLGDEAYQACAIGKKDGSLKAGFQQTGHYTNPDCIRPAMQERISAILAAAPFNSWFLDAYASGMVFDSYPPAKPMSERENARGNEESMRWVSETLKLPLGSEDGNAVTSGGMLFAHGKQTPVIGWGDKAMQKDKASPYFVGAWYPTEEPDKFFKPVPLQDGYRAIYFEPKSRLPLYQAVFHGSVITSHHWLFDSLKLTNVRRENELVQLLYNVPPLYHLSADRLKSRLAIIQKQDAFFRPLHQRLAREKLTAFDWLTDDHLVQQTTFEDGTRLIANFGDKDTKFGTLSLKAGSIAALIPGEKQPIVHQANSK